MSPAPKQTGASQAWSCETLAEGMEHVCDGLAYDAAEEERLLKELQDSGLSNYPSTTLVDFNRYHIYIYPDVYTLQ